mmetsp:Transcript_28395/g.87006  ORF Transcript_28395/g.87006 Transcript_28395/m.87006 type:complete len:284 (-) Transcript_28395:267-1118(-)
MEAPIAGDSDPGRQQLLSDLEYRVGLIGEPNTQLSTAEELANVSANPPRLVAAPTTMSVEELGDIGAAAQAAAEASPEELTKEEATKEALSSLASAATATPTFSIGKKIDDQPPVAAPLGAAGPTAEGEARPTRQRRSSGTQRAHSGQPSSTGKTKGDYQKKYRATEKGKAAQRKAQEKYRRSEKGNIAQMRARKKWRETHPHQRSASSGGNNAPAPAPATTSEVPATTEVLPDAVSTVVDPLVAAAQTITAPVPAVPVPDVIAPPPPPPSQVDHLQILGRGT